MIQSLQATMSSLSAGGVGIPSRMTLTKRKGERVVVRVSCDLRRATEEVDFIDKKSVARAFRAAARRGELRVKVY